MLIVVAIVCFTYSAGMINHDVIMSISGQHIQTTEEVSDAVQSGSPLSMVVLQAKEDVMLTVVPEKNVIIDHASDVPTT